VGLDKYGGNTLLNFIVLSALVSQIKQYVNILLQAGGLISKSSKLDINEYYNICDITIIHSKINKCICYSNCYNYFGLIFLILYFALLKKELMVEVKIITTFIIKIFFDNLAFYFSKSIINN
jgi:hypothetical protein